MISVNVSLPFSLLICLSSLLGNSQTADADEAVKMAGMTVGGVPVAVQNGIAYESAASARSLASVSSVAAGSSSGPVLGAAALALPPPVGVLLGPTAGVTTDPLVLQMQQMQQLQQMQQMQVR